MVPGLSTDPRSRWQDPGSETCPVNNRRPAYILNSPTSRVMPPRNPYVRPASCVNHNHRPRHRVFIGESGLVALLNLVLMSCRVSLAIYANAGRIPSRHPSHAERANPHVQHVLNEIHHNTTYVYQQRTTSRPIPGRGI